MMARLGRVMFVVLVIAMCRGITASRLRYCGRQLADAMALVCHGHYNTAMGEFKMRHANRFFTLSDEVESQRHDPTYKHTTRHRDYVVIANKVKRNDVGKKHDEPLENFDIGHFSSHGDTLKSESERPNNNLNLIPNGETTSHSTLIRHHRDRYILKDKKLHKMDIRNKKGKVADDNAESPPPSQIGTISPYFLGRTLVLPSSRKSFNPHQ
ncbi:hypothetical protein AAG570_007601 [Ranatra chinensis]|uniref:Secreted protein n=1 Tax=Ranatra chinensis TaxID=642074 RepID=A0ABD0XVA6_9HEMI